MRFTLLSLLFFLCFISCATTSLPPVTKDLRLEDDEKRLWNRSEEEEKMINRSGVIYNDKELETYLNDIAKKLLPSEIFKRIPFKIIVLRNHLLNAFAYPNGVIYVHTGILARMDNKAQLATLLAHEMTHVTHRHLVEQFRDIKNKTAFLATIQVTTAGMGVYGSLASLIGAIGTVAAVTGYSREHETEADSEGFRLMEAAGYDPKEAPKLFMHLKKDLEEEKRKEPFFFGTHPRIVERLENYETLLKARSQEKRGGILNTKIFLEKIGRVILDNARDDLKAGRFKIAERGAEKHLKIKPESAEAYSLLGDIRRQRGKGEDLETAKDHYQKAISINPSYPDSHKGIGLIHFKRGEKALAIKALEFYLTLSPQALDRGYIEEYIHQCREGGKE
jgi:Zn-dependent protease with chaperone function